MDKVYCINCKWYDRYWICCRNPLYIVTRNTPVSIDRKAGEVFILNATNDCKEYEVKKSFLKMMLGGK